MTRQVLIELGNAEGFSTISHAREYLLDLTRDDDPFLPCHRSSSHTHQSLTHGSF